ncbi:uncharacterized protein V1510DRAFT_388336 [Dipodascopsis tothii]|uniref:uncharacterized protein n=1 Tax=Dipodascopsis tothii TaxID=44089 RepID=UPI0034CF9E5C
MTVPEDPSRGPLSSDDDRSSAVGSPETIGSPAPGITSTVAGNGMPMEIVEGEALPEDDELLAELPEDSTEVELVQLKVRSMSALGLQRFDKLQTICLRQNLLTTLQGIEDIRSPALTELDLYDNRIPSLSRLDGLAAALEKVGVDGVPYADTLENLDLSFNLIKHIKGVRQFRRLRNLYFVQNRIGRIENLEGLSALENLELGGNRLRKLENLEPLTALRELWVGKNKIARLENLAPLRNLRILSIQSNRLTKLEGLDELEGLEELYVSFNGLTKLEGLERNVNLRTIDVSNNRIAHVEGLAHLTKLEEFWASYNQLASFDEIERELRALPALETVYFEGNPLHLQNRHTYRNKVQLALGPTIKQIDASMVRSTLA